MRYDSQTYPRLIMTTTGTELKVSVMEKADTGTERQWKLLMKEDKLFYTRENVILNNPNLLDQEDSLFFANFQTSTERDARDICLAWCTEHPFKQSYHLPSINYTAFVSR